MRVDITSCERIWGTPLVVGAGEYIVMGLELLVMGWVVAGRDLLGSADANMSLRRLSPVEAVEEREGMDEAVALPSVGFAWSWPPRTAKRDSTVIFGWDAWAGTAEERTGVGSIFAKSLSSSETPPLWRGGAECDASRKWSWGSDVWCAAGRRAMASTIKKDQEAKLKASKG
jgi:hypothetical protein